MKDLKEHQILVKQKKSIKIDNTDYETKIIELENKINNNFKLIDKAKIEKLILICPECDTKVFLKDSQTLVKVKNDNKPSKICIDTVKRKITDLENHKQKCKAVISQQVKNKEKSFFY